MSSFKSFKISVITVCRNSANSIEDTITSVLSQTYKDIEYIIIDGASADGTLDIINKYKASISKVVSEKDSGHIYAMNKGIRLATGDVIHILNSDDSFYDADVVSDIADEFKKNPHIDLFYGKAKYIDLPEYFSPPKNFEIKSKKDFINNKICHQTVFVKKEVFNKTGLLETKYKVGADYNWLLTVFDMPEIKIAYVDRYIVNYSCLGASFKNWNIFVFEIIIISFKHFSFFDFLKFLLIFTMQVLSVEEEKLKLFLNKIRKYSKHLKNLPVFLNKVIYKFSKPSVALPYKPLSLTVWICDRCNLKCAFCLRNKDLVEYRHDILPDMTLETFKKIVKKFNTAFTISFIGQGEPLLNKNLFEMIEYAGKRKKTTRLVTNGVLLDDYVCEKIMASKLNTIDISLKASSAKDFEKITCCPASDYEKAISGVRYLVELKQRLKADKKIVLSYVLWKTRLHDIPRAIELAESLKVNTLLFLNFIPFGAFDSSGSKEILFEDDKETISFINALKKIPRKLEIIWPVLLRRSNYSGYCSSNFSNLCIDSAGNIGLCDRVIPPSKEYGNIFKDRNVWNAKCFQQMRARLLSENKDRDLPLRCKLCVDMSSGPRR